MCVNTNISTNLLAFDTILLTFRFLSPSFSSFIRLSVHELFSSLELCKMAGNESPLQWAFVALLLDTRIRIGCSVDGAEALQGRWG